MKKKLGVLLSIAMLLTSVQFLNGCSKSEKSDLFSNGEVVPFEIDEPEKEEVKDEAFQLLETAYDNFLKHDYYKEISSSKTYNEYYVCKSSDHNQKPILYGIGVAGGGIYITSINKEKTKVDKAFMLENGNTIENLGDIESDKPLKIVKDGNYDYYIAMESGLGGSFGIPGGLLRPMSVYNHKDDKLYKIVQFQSVQSGEYTVLFIKGHTQYNNEGLKEIEDNYRVILKDGEIVQNQYYYKDDSGALKRGRVTNFYDFDAKKIDDFNFDETVKEYSKFEGLTYLEMYEKIKK